MIKGVPDGDDEGEDKVGRNFKRSLIICSLKKL